MPMMQRKNTIRKAHHAALTARTTRGSAMRSAISSVEREIDLGNWESGHRLRLQSEGPDGCGVFRWGQEEEQNARAPTGGNHL